MPIQVLKAGVFQLAWGSEVYARVTAVNLYGPSVVSESGNGAIILTYPDSPISVNEDYS